jgi:serine/threonine protein kinase
MSSCGSSEQLEQFLHDELQIADRDAILAHLEECAACQHVLDQKTSGPLPFAPSSPETPQSDEQIGHLLKRLKTGQSPPIDADRFAPRAFADAGTGSHGGDREVEASGDCGLNTPLLSPWPAVDGFNIIREVGRGGMGIVYEARDERLSRRVALKVLSAGTLIDPIRDLRFEREAKAAARLHHTNIVPVFGFGRQSGHSYYVMQFIAGRGLNQVLQDLRRTRDAKSGRVSNRIDSAAKSPSDPSGFATSSSDEHGFYRGIARIGLQVAEALAYAHGQGVLHRDIKPSNLLLDQSANVWVTDFGLAKTADADDLTHTGDLVGTVRYMAAERFDGRCDARSDVYSLGLTLYELAALRPAYDAPDRYALIDRVRGGEPSRLRSLAPKVPRDLETIIHKAIALEPARRYATAAALADDLGRFIEDRPIHARRAGFTERTLRWCRRNPWVTAFLIAVTIGAIASTSLAIRATRAERSARNAQATTKKEWNRAETERNRAEKSRDRALSALRVLLGKGSDTPVEEVRPFRRSLLTAGLRESQTLVADLEGDPRALSQYVHALEALATVHNEAGDRGAAVERAHQAVAFAENLLARDPSSVDYRVALASALHYAAAIEPDDATRIATARRSTEFYESLCREHRDGDRVNWLHCITMNHYNSGHLLSVRGQNAKAIDSFLAALSTCRHLADLGDRSPVVRDLEGRIELYLRRAYTATNRPADAIAAGRRGIEIFKELVREYPESFENAWQLHLADEELGHAGMAYLNWNLAIEGYESSRKTLLAMASRHGGVVSRMVNIQNGLAETDYNLRDAYDSDPVRYAAERRELAREAFEICDKLSRFQSLSWNLRVVYAQNGFDIEDYQEEEGAQPDLELLLKSERSWVSILRDAPTVDLGRTALVIVRRRLADSYSAHGHLDEADRWGRCALESVRERPDLLYQIAREYARRSALIGVLPTKLGPAQIQARRQQYLADAIAILREAVSAGFKDAPRLGAETAFAPIHSSADFKAILTELVFRSAPFANSP